MSPVPSVFQLSFVDLIVLKQTFIIDITNNQYTIYCPKPAHWNRFLFVNKQLASKTNFTLST